MKTNRPKITDTSDRARTRLGLAPANGATPNTKRQAIPVVRDESPSPQSRLAMIRVMLRGAALEVGIGLVVPGGGGMRLDRYALMYARELLVQEFAANGWQPPTDALSVLDAHIDKMTR